MCINDRSPGCADFADPQGSRNFKGSLSNTKEKNCVRVRVRVCDLKIRLGTGGAVPWEGAVSWGSACLAQEMLGLSSQSSKGNRARAKQQCSSHAVAVSPECWLAVPSPVPSLTVATYLL